MSRRVNISRASGGSPIAVQDAVQRALGDVQKVGAIYPLGAPTRVYYDDYRARMGELVLLDPSDAALTVTLPDVSYADIGRSITVVNASSSTNAITVRPSRGTIEGASSNLQATAWSKVVYIAVAISPTEKWIKANGAGGSSIDSDWSNFDTTMPSGVSTDPVGCWALNGGNDYLLDLSDEANDLSATAEEIFTSVPSMIGFMCDGTTSYLNSSPAQSSLVISTALTIEVLYCQRKQQSASGLIVGVGNGGGEDGSENYQYSLWVAGTASGLGAASNVSRLIYYHEYDSGSPEEWDTRAGLEVGETALITIVRHSDGVQTEIYLNGQLIEETTLSNAPTGGDGAIDFRVGYGCYGTVYGARITPVEFTAAQVLASYERLRRVL